MILVLDLMIGSERSKSNQNQKLELKVTMGCKPPDFCRIGPILTSGVNLTTLHNCLHAKNKFLIAVNV